jgi:hypothetical protein
MPLTEGLALFQDANMHTSVKNVDLITQPSGANRALNHQMPKQLCEINIDTLMQYLIDYEPSKRRFLQLGLANGFSLHYHGPDKFSFFKNHKSADENPHIVDMKLAKELQQNRIAGPFADPPFRNFHVAPIGVVPKKDPNSFRLIHDLSFPNGQGINAYTPKQYCSVRYETIDNVLEILNKLGPGTLIAKADIESAFRILPVSPLDYNKLGICWRDEFYFDKRLPMGASISCSTFEELSRALQWILVNCFQIHSVSHILDDFIFLGNPNSDSCFKSLEMFERLMIELNIPLNKEKTVLPSTCVIVHGLEVDTVEMVLRLPEDKLVRARDQLHTLYRKKSATLKELQSILGLLNFACRAIYPGRAFLRRLFDLTQGLTKPSHHVRLNSEAKADIKTWLDFLQQYNGITVIPSTFWQQSDSIKFETDASTTIGYGARFGNEWFSGMWCTSQVPIDVHINILELYCVMLAIATWGPQIRNTSFILLCDNLSVVHCLNKLTSKDKEMMRIIREVVILTLTFNIRFKATHIPGSFNICADLLSRNQVVRAKQQFPDLRDTQSTPPQHLLPSSWWPVN